MRRSHPDSGSPLGTGPLPSLPAVRLIPRRPRYIAYGLPRKRDDSERRVVDCGEFELHDEPIGSPVSFLDFDGAVVFAGAFDEMHADSFIAPDFTCRAPADLDRREREFYTMHEQRRIVVFLVSQLPDDFAGRAVPTRNDLFRRFAKSIGLEWQSLSTPSQLARVETQEFNAYLGKYGTAYVKFEWPERMQASVTPLFGRPAGVFGGAIRSQIFIVPCTYPHAAEQIVDAARAALEATLAFRKRISTELPEWVANFQFANELGIRANVADLRRQLMEREGAVDGYTKLKRALALQSDPLVEVVVQIFKDAFGLKLVVNDVSIEDATLDDDEGKILAVFEIKGVKGNFTRQHVNQVDSHRERITVPAATPGILLVNTMMGASSLEEKDERPHPDIVQKAVVDNVLLIRTLDLLRYVDAIEKGVLTAESFKNVLLSECGWLMVEDDTAFVIKE